MNKHSFLKTLLLTNFVFSAAALGFNFGLVSSANASELDEQTQIITEKNIDSELWGEISGDFQTCEVTVVDSKVAEKKEPSDISRNVVSVSPIASQNITTTQLNNIALEVNRKNNLQLCN
ncbi:MAG: hypothetical protein QNJ38_20730 [Prochloraceae cyanobacterium]|nr:hypothetical protein [Prochloraceae cyanobacterium]